MNVSDAPLAGDATKNHRFDRAEVDGSSAIGSGDSFDACDPRCIACIPVRPADQGASNRCTTVRLFASTTASCIGRSITTRTKNGSSCSSIWRARLTSPAEPPPVDTPKSSTPSSSNTTTAAGKHYELATRCVKVESP